MNDFVIDPSTVDKDPYNQFTKWYDEYVKTDPEEPTAVFLATADKQGVPGGRVVLMKSYDSRGFVFFTNYESRKGRDLEKNPQASLTFYWPELKRQVRVYGEVEKVSAKESDQYFASRPLESCIGAWASHQGEVLENRSDLTDKMDKFRKKFKSVKKIPRPDYWGGYRVKPKRIEFWQGRDNRTHDRVEYFMEKKTWKRQRLSP